MRSLLLTSFFLLICITAQSQNNTGSVHFKLKNVKGETFIAVEQGLTQRHLPLNNGSYSDTISGPAFYTLANYNEVLTIYGEPDTHLTIKKFDRNGVITYKFSGKGSEENKFLARLTKAQQQYLPVNGDLLTDEVNMIAPTDFIKRLDQYKAISMQMLATHDFNPDFIYLEKAYVDCKIHSYALQYFENYGVNAEKKRIYLKNLTDGDAGLNTPQGKQAALNAVYTKELTFNDRKIIAPRIYPGFDMNNDELFKYSPIYSSFVLEEINSMAQTGAYHGSTYAQRRIEAIKQVIISPFIRKILLDKYGREI